MAVLDHHAPVLPPAGVLINLAFATAFNLPCLWVQRYNRLRLQRLLGKG